MNKLESYKKRGTILKFDSKSKMNAFEKRIEPIVLTSKHKSNPKNNNLPNLFLAK